MDGWVVMGAGWWGTVHGRCVGSIESVRGSRYVVPSRMPAAAAAAALRGRVGEQRKVKKKQGFDMLRYLVAVANCLKSLFYILTFLILFLDSVSSCPGNCFPSIAFHGYTQSLSLLIDHSIIFCCLPARLLALPDCACPCRSPLVCDDPRTALSPCLCDIFIV
ncbi:hypothetical protein DFH27DRAFT_1437 [Peziza echinospora]|nr:hypothetical protein DFH27DRAFT_1437 [Peziza echinospora]